MRDSYVFRFVLATRGRRSRTCDGGEVLMLPPCVVRALLIWLFRICGLFLRSIAVAYVLAAIGAYVPVAVS